MTTSIAKHLLMRDRLDWNRPHVNWLPDAFYSIRFPRKHDKLRNFRLSRRNPAQKA